MPLSVWSLRIAGPRLFVSRPPHAHGRNTLEPLHPYHYGFHQVEYPTIRTSGVTVPALGCGSAIVGEVFTRGCWGGPRVAARRWAAAPDDALRLPGRRP